MGKIRQVQLQMLDRHLEHVAVPDRPSGGWIRALRTALGMSLQQVATRLGIAKQSMARLEANEATDAITLKSLRRAAEALDCQLVYALVPREGSLQAQLQKQATRKARDIVYAVDHTMQLEAQGVGNVQEKIQQLAEELARDPNSRLWDEE